MKKGSIVLVLCVVMTMLVAGCGKEVAVTPEPASTSEVVSEEIVSEEIVLDEVPETVTEEVSEVASEEPSEKVSEEVVEEIEYTNFSNYMELFEYLKELNKTAIVKYNFSEGIPQAIIPNGQKYTLEKGDTNITVISTNNNIIDIKANVYYIHASIGVVEGAWDVYVDTTGTDLEVSFTVVYEDGTEEDFTVYITKEE